MNKYIQMIVKKAELSDAIAIMNIIQKRCKWLDENNINQWNTTRTYAQEYYEQKIKEGKFYVAILDEKIIRDIYASV